MKSYISIFAICAAILSCDPSGIDPENPDNPMPGPPVVIEGNFGISYPMVGWNEGDVVVLSNCTEDLVFENGKLVPCDNAEIITVTSEMIGADGYTIQFEPSVPASDKYAVITADDFTDIAGLGTDGKVTIATREADMELNYVACATSADGRFVLSGAFNYFSIGIYDRSVHFIDVSAGYSFFDIEVENVPAVYYFALPLDEDMSDGIYANAYDKSSDKTFSGHYTDVMFCLNEVLELENLIDAGDSDIDLIKQIVKDNDTVEAIYNLEGDVLKRYLDEVQYDDDYSYTKIKNYVPKSNEAGTLKPAYVPLKGLKNAKKIYLVSEDFDIQTRNVSMSEKQAIYNLIPGRTYRYGVVSVDSSTGKETLLSKGCIATEGRVRYIKTSSYMHNVRDIGGWKGLDGKHIRYGILIRGSEFMDSREDLSKYEASDYESLVNQVGIDFDLDFRTDDGAGNFKKSPVGIEFLRIPLSAYDSIVAKSDRWAPFKKAILKFIDNARAGKCTYVHCQGGADRTGTFVFYLEGLLGVCDSDLCKDYEITSFYYHKERNDPERYLPMIQALRKRFGKDCTIGEAIYKSAKEMGITDQNIQDLRDLMLE